MYNSIVTIIGEALKKAYGVSTEVTLRASENPLHGDITSPIAMEIGKQLKKPPQEIAEMLAHVLTGAENIERVEVAGPGFLNITLTVAARLEEMEGAREACRRKESRQEPPVILEYSQPNIAKPLGVHHILSTVIGQAVSNLYRHLGFHVLSWNYIGDWGTQFGKLAVAMEHWGEKGKEASDYTLDELLDLYVKFHEEVEAHPELEDESRTAFRKLEQGDRALRAFWKDVVAVTSESIQKIYARLYVAFDETKGESFYEDKMAAVIEEGKRKGVFKEGEEGALIVEFPEGSNLPVYMVMKGDGATLYATRDLAQMRYRIDTYHPRAILIFTDIAQQLYFEQLETTCRKLGWELPEFENVLFGRMSFPDKAMSTRKGNILKLEDVLDEAVRRADVLIAEHESQVRGEERMALAEMMGVGAVVYTILSQSRKTNIIFTWEKALTFEGNSGPYLQYTHARARSVLRKAGARPISPPKHVETLEPAEQNLMKHLAQFPLTLEQARAEAMPHKVANYLYGLSQSFNSFYSALPILDTAEPQRSLRLALTELTADALKVGAEILTLRVPDRM